VYLNNFHLSSAQLEKIFHDQLKKQGRMLSQSAKIDQATSLKTDQLKKWNNTPV
jgi:hypothetical protein